jgi:hypothetical protein
VTATDPYAALRTDLTGIPPLDAMGAHFHEPAAADRIPNTAPERVVYVPGPGGTMVPVLADHYPQTPAAPSPAPYETAPADPQRDVWPKRMMAAGGSAAAVIGSIALAGPRLSEAGHAAEMGGIGIACAAAGAGILVSLVKGSMGSRQARVDVSVTVAPTINATSTSRSRSRSR